MSRFTMANIFQLQHEFLSIFDEIEENEGIITPELEEKLNITRESFIDKIKDYVGAIKLLTAEIDLIKNEKVRLDSLKKSKEKTIERLKKIMIEAIDKFGDTNKSGNKFVDYGIGKVSVRNSEVVTIDEDSIERFINRYVSGLSWYNMQGQLDSSIIQGTDLLEYANSKTSQEEDDDEDVVEFTTSDIGTLDANISLNINVSDLLQTEKGFALAKALIDYNEFDIKAKANKTTIKNEAKVGVALPSYAAIENNKILTIK